MSNFISTFVAAIMAIITFFSSANGFKQLINHGDISGFADSVTEEKEIPDLYTDENGDLTVLQFSDTHFTTGLSYADVKLFEKMEEQIKAYTPDLVVMLGDMINDGDFGAFNKQYVLDTVADIFERNNQYWAYIPGNNDGLNYGSSADVTMYLSQFDHCLATDVKEVSGGAQYTIDIYNGDALVHSFLFLDTMDYDDEDKDHIYGYVHEDQVKWCEEAINSKLAVNESITMSVFLHENTPAFAKAGISGECYKDGYAPLDKMTEKYNIPKNQPLDDVFDDSGCVGLLSMGHAHPSENKCSFYNNTYYHVTTQTKVSSTLLTIHTSADNVRDMYEFEVIK